MLSEKKKAFCDQINLENMVQIKVDYSGHFMLFHMPMVLWILWEKYYMQKYPTYLITEPFL